jgi:hypothetical protein
MALQLTRILKDSTITMVNAYSRIEKLNFKNPGRVYIQVGIYEKESDAQDDKKPLDTVDYWLQVDEVGGKGALNYDTAYAWLKARDEWSEAIDV